MTIDIHHGGSNVYVDLNLPDAEAMVAKARLVAQLGQVVRSLKLSWKEAASVIGLPAGEFSQIMRGRFRLYQVEDVAGWLEIMLTQKAKFR